MQEVSLSLRIAYFNKLQGITYLGKPIPVYEEFVQETVGNMKAKLTIGNMTVEAYIILLNQTENDNSPKCHRNDECSIQIQVTTVWPSDKGGSMHAEKIMNLVYDKLFPTSSIDADLTIESPFKIWKKVKIGGRPINYDTDTNRVWIKTITMNNWVSQP